MVQQILIRFQMIEKDILNIPRDGSLRSDVAQHITQYLEYLSMDTEARLIAPIADTRQKIAVRIQESPFAGEESFALAFLFRFSGRAVWAVQSSSGMSFDILSSCP